jgi:hypothetical protein
MCHRWTHGPGAAVYRAPGGEAAEFADVHTCGSVWHCPICAAKITNSRREELQAAIAAWAERGGEVYLVTRTFSHEKHGRELSSDDGDAPGLMQLMSKALSRAKGTRRALALAERAGVVGTIRALEVTHGEMNGWHPHTHELVFARPGELGRLRTLRNGWIRELMKRGIAGMRAGMTKDEKAEQLRYLRRHALTVQGGRFAAEYVAKFGMEPRTESGGRHGLASEVARGHVKAGQRFSGRTPFGLLQLYVEEGDKRAGMLFREYALAFMGRRQLYWGELRKQLAELCQLTAEQVYMRDGGTAEWRAWEARARFILQDRTDEDIAATRTTPCSEFVIRLSSEEWRTVLRTNARHDVLMAAQFDGLAGVRDLLEQLGRAPPTHGGEFVADWRKFDRGKWRLENKR